MRDYGAFSDMLEEAGWHAQYGGGWHCLDCREDLTPAWVEERGDQLLADLERRTPRPPGRPDLSRADGGPPPAGLGRRPPR